MLLITNQLGMLEHMSPCDYAIVRTALGHGAGFDSPGFRRVHKVSPLLGEAFDGLLTDAASRCSRSTSGGTTSTRSISSPNR